MVYYRTYRPQTIAELDSSKLRETLTAILSAKEIPHAFLFTGPKGLGKTSTARIIAKVLNCTGKKRNGIEPCNECEQCVSITNGNNIDVLEIDGASNRGIDEIRDLREKVNLAPVAAKRKVYIIDEVHMLTTEAFNALLKTIEEPPAHVVFIFATTEPQKVPATIISRCFHIQLSRATKEELLRALKRIVSQEKIDIQSDALDLLAEMGDGGYRDSVKILEEIIALSGNGKITKEFVEEKLHVSGGSVVVRELLKNLSKKDAKASLNIVATALQQGMEMRFLLQQLLDNLHNMLIERVTLSKPTDDIQQLITLFSKAYQETKYAPIPSLPLELAIVSYCQTNPSIPEAPGPKSSGALTMQDVVKKEQTLKVKQVLSGAKPEEKKKENLPQDEIPQDSSDTKHLLENLIYKVKPFNHSVAGVLRGCTIGSLTQDELHLVTPYKFHKEKLEEGKIRDILEQVVREVTGKSIRVMVELKG